jgi:predicted nucleic acid-binding Zn finger protein
MQCVRYFVKGPIARHEYESDRLCASGWGQTVYVGEDKFACMSNIFCSCDFVRSNVVSSEQGNYRVCRQFGRRTVAAHWVVNDDKRHLSRIR